MFADGKFIFQLEAHQQQNQYNNSSALTSPCRWIPVPTVIQQQKNNIKKISEWSSHHQKNKTIWPYLVADQPAAIGSKSPQQIHKSLSLPTVKPGERHLFQHCQQRTTPPPLTPIAAVNPQGCTTSVVVATTKNIVRRPSRKYSTTALIENVTDPQHLNRQPQSLQLRNLLRRSQQHQHQSFIMVATKAIKAQRRLTPLLKKQRRRHCQRLVAKTAVGNEPPLFDTLQPRAVNLEPVVRYLWCRRHTSELLRKQLSLNNNLDVSVDNTLPVFSQNNTADSLCSNISGSSKCKPVFSPSSLATSVAVFPTTKISTDSLSGIGSNSSSSPLKKYKIGHNQQKRQLFVDSSPKIAIPSLSAHTPTNNHSITAILSGNIMGAKRGSTTTSIKETDPCVISSTVTSTSTASPVTTPQKNVSPAPLSLLRTLLKSPSCETNSQPVKQASSNSSGYMKQNTGSSRKRSAIDSQIISPAIISTPEVSNSGPITATMAISPTIKNSAVDDSTAALSVLRQLPTLQHPGAAGQLAAAGYFNVLYHQAAMAAAMAYQSHVQLPQSLSKPTPLSQAPTMLSSQFSTTGGSHNGWPCQLNRQPPLSVPETIMGENGVATPSLSTSTIVAPYSSPLPTATVNGNGQLPPATPSPPPLLMHPVHPRHLLLHHMQQHNQHQHYQPAPTVQQSLSYYQHKKRHLNSNVNKRTAPMGDTAEYGSNIEKNNVVVYKESSSTGKCSVKNDLN